MNTLYVSIDSAPDELQHGLRLLAAEHPITEEKRPNTRTVEFAPADEFRVSTLNDVTTVYYAERVQVYRALGRLFGDPSPVGIAVEYDESPQFGMVGVMLDCSRNAVHSVAGVKRIIRNLALMGINALCLYTEDTYEVPGEPYFGMGRGAYSEGELRELDEYGATFGVEMFPCIQALAHLAQIIQWDAYRDVSDTKQILLAEDDRTYTLLRKMIEAATKPFQSKRIHLGMDEAHGLGSGRYKEINGEKRPFDIMLAHMGKVLEMTREMGLDPMMWSDMWFRLGSERDDYYDMDSVIPQDVIDLIPDDVVQVYWDYYHRDEDFYREWIARHRKLGSEPLVAPGAWTWGRLWTHYPFAFATVEPCVKVCKETGVKDLLMTMWGDDGAECDFLSALPVLQFFGDHAYNEAPDGEMTRNNFRGVTGGDFDVWLLGGDLDAVSTLEDRSARAVNTSKWLLHDDPLMGIMQPILEGHSYAQEYRELEVEIDRGIETDGLLDHHLEFPKRLARVLSIKCDLPARIRSAYEARDKRALEHIVADELPVLAAEVKGLWQTHRELWHEQHKPQGWEVIDGRYGRLMSRIDTAQWRLTGWLEGEIDRLPELEQHIEKPLEGSPKALPGAKYERIFTVSTIK